MGLQYKSKIVHRHCTVEGALPSRPTNLRNLCHTDIITNIKILEERLQEVNIELGSLYNQKKMGSSPGLESAILNLEKKNSNIKTSLDLWRDVYKVYPNYDR